MKLYLAGNFPAMKKPEYEKHLYNISMREIGVYRRLLSFHFEDDIKTVYNLAREMEKVDLFLDSGAFSAWSKDTEISMEDYCRHIADHIELISIYANLDVINDGEESYRNWRRMRALGFNPMPVYHAETDLKYLIKYLDSGVDHVAIGAISQMTTSARLANLDLLWRTYLTDDMGYPIRKFHGFGLTAPEIATRYPWYSVDSTSWVLYGRYGIVLIPKWDNEWVFDHTPHQICVSSRSPMQFRESSKHWNTCTDMEKEHHLRYFREKGFRLGESDAYMKDGKIKEEIKEEGLRNNWKLRDELNMIYYLNMERFAPEYPWKSPLKKLPFI
jgi:hypothetical protein